jgi:hypothetical protein
MSASVFLTAIHSNLTSRKTSTIANLRSRGFGSNVQSQCTRTHKEGETGRDRERAAPNLLAQALKREYTSLP